MEKYRLRFKESVAKDLQRIPAKNLKRILKSIESLRAQPRPTGCEKLSIQEKYRLRQGDYRIVYEILDNNCDIIIVKVGYRRSVYKNL